MNQSDQIIESPIRAEIFSVERLEEYAAYMAAELKITEDPKLTQPLLARLRENGEKLLESYRSMAEAIHEKEIVSPGAEWLVDNFHIVEEQLREIKHDLPPRFYKELPKLAIGELAGFPRIYALALALVAHSDSRLDTETIRRFVQAYQRTTALEMGELWALAITLRIVLVENLRRFALRIAWDRDQTKLANQLADQIIENVKDEKKFHELILQIPGYCKNSVQNDSAFIAQLAKRLRDQEAEIWPSVECLEKHLVGMNSSTEQAVHVDHQLQASTQVSVGNIITSMRLLSSLDWQDFFESVSLVDRVLEADPEGSYRKMDFSTRDRYRHVVEKIAKQTHHSEIYVAEKVVQLAEDSRLNAVDDRRRSHVGFYLIGDGIEKLEKSVNKRNKLKFLFSVLSNSKLIYFGLIILFLVSLCMVPLNYSALHGASKALLFAIACLILIPLSDLALNITNFIINHTTHPKRLPKLDLTLGIPENGTTMVVIPCLLSSTKVIHELLEKLEIHYLGNNDARLSFALLTDFTDSLKQSSSDDSFLLNTAIEGIAKLNLKYSEIENISAKKEIFFIFNRKRQWNPHENKWMGWERKRGKLQEFNLLLRGAKDTSFNSVFAHQEFLKTIRFVITLDADTQLPRDSARKMIGTILHPLNQANFDNDLGRVTEGYGILQPRISVSLESSTRSNFAKVYSGYIGIDPYTTAVSDVYQDLFNEGSFTGKGLYDVDAFESALKNRVPENAILSHDLFEGLYARVALLTDVELFDDFPQSYHEFFTRQHRWTRGDWQIAKWLLPFVPNAKKQLVRNRLPIVARWKIFDNLRRSLVAPSTLLLFLLGSTILPGSALFWLGTGLLIIGFPALSYVASAIISSCRGTNRSSFSTKWQEFKKNLLQSFLYFVFLAHQAQVSLDAVIRVAYRTLISKSKLLEWTAAAAVREKTLMQARIHDAKAKKPFWQTFWPVEIFLFLVIIFLTQLPLTMLFFVIPFIVLWASYPLVATYLSEKSKRTKVPLSSEDKKLLRQIARRTWNYFETFVGAQDNFLPPDNYQEDPKPVIAHRTSPTNIGVYLLSLVAARDLGYICGSKMIERLGLTLTSMNKLEKFKGHYFNWYDTETLLPLYPKYISTVDSGNLAGHLLAIKQACLDLPNMFVFEKSIIDGLKDSIGIIDFEIKKSLRQNESFKEIIRCQELLSSFPLKCFSDWNLFLESLTKSLEDVRVVLLESESRHPELRESIYWTNASILQSENLWKELVSLAPWIDKDFTKSSLSKLNDLFEGLDHKVTYSALGNALQIAVDSAKNISGISPELLFSLNEANLKISRVLKESENLASSFNRIFEDMDFTFLMDKERRVFSIGYNFEEQKNDNSVYDLLASECRLACFIAIAKGDIVQKHWFQLGRQLVPAGDGRALISWSASMFEYLMPLLVMRSYKNTLLDETMHNVVAKQISYGEKNKVPWGISEAGYNARDLQLNYQYGPFGVPGLGLKRGLSHELVVSPYSTLLAAMVMPSASVENLKRLINDQLLTEFGFYESIDFTAERRTDKQKFAVIKSYMAHHQGMSLVSIDNVINDKIMQNRFHSEPCIRATQLLLQERIPQGVTPLPPRAAEVELTKEPRAAFNPYIRQYTDPNTSSPRVQLLSNGNYSVMLSTAGSGYSKCGERAVSRWSEDPTRDQSGSFIFIKNLSDKKYWSTSYQPTTDIVPDSYQVTFGEDKVEFRRRDDNISSYTEILVAAEVNVEIRHVSLTNHSSEPQILEITSYLEPVLSPTANDLDHPAFSKLFLQTEFLPSRDALLVRRRKRSENDEIVWGFHVVVADKEFISETQYETDRSRFIGRGKTLKNPNVILEDKRLSNTVGATLDPIFSLRVKIELQPGETGRVAFTTGIAMSREEALELSDRYHDINSFDRESKLAWTKSQVDMRHLNIDSETAHLFERLAGKILYSANSLRPSSQHLTLHTSMQSNLWAYGISGDLPILVVSVTEAKDLPVVRQLLRCHEYLRLKGLSYDFVILNEHGPTYFQGLQDELQQQIRTTGSQAFLNKPGGVFILRSDITPKEHRANIQAVARVSLFADHPLKEQIDRKVVEEKYPALLTSASKTSVYESHEVAVPKLNFFNDYGGFSEDGREYVIILDKSMWTPAPWINVIGNSCDFGFQVSESGSGFTWSVNSQGNRLTPWSNDPVSDPSGEIIYLRDDETGAIWSPTPLPIREDSNYVVRHGQGYTTFEHVSHGFHSTLTMFVPKDDTIKLSVLKLKNLTSKNRKVSVTSYTEWVLGTQRRKTAANLICDVDAETGAIFAGNPYDNEFFNRVAFADISESSRTFTCSRKAFLGRNGNYESPAALKRQGLTQKKGTGHEPCAVLQTDFDFQPNEDREMTILLGQCENSEKARALTLKYRDKELVQKSFIEMKDHWNELVSTIQVKTPEPAINVMMNSWLLYQNLSCRFWSRTAFYQSGGAYGFRDQLQDSMALVYSAPKLTREHILRASARQFKEGDVQHWWHPPSGRGVRTRMTDDLLWLPFVVSFYIQVTGDHSILNETAPFIKAPLLNPGQEDSYTVPEVSDESASIFEHCTRAIDRALTMGQHGLPLIGTGDWNDGMNRVGAHGKGESVWLGWFLYKVIKDFMPFCQATEERKRKAQYETVCENLKISLEENGWDGEWYRRAYFDDGTPLGSASSEECQIDSLAQTWSILSGAGDVERSRQAMKKVDERLVQRDSKIVLLLTPPFDKGAVDPGYIKGYVPGVRENGGQYTHAAIWVIMAQAEMGNGDTAMELFNMINPMNHARNKIESDKYKIEPYVLAGDVYGNEAHMGRGGWSWYTGAASWYYRAGLESILGFKLRDNKLTVKPSIPASWKSYEIIYTFGSTKYHVTIENPLGLNQGSSVIDVDGMRMPGHEVLLVDNGVKHTIHVTLEKH